MTGQCFLLNLLRLSALCGLLLSVSCSSSYDPDVQDEAMRAGKTADDFPTHPYDLFADMDGGIELSQDEFMGRNTWLMWTGGNAAFWDYLARHSYGLVDFLKLLDSRHCERADRLRNKGLINEPGMRQATKANRWGLRLDVPEGWTGEWPPDAESYLDYKTRYPQAPDPEVYGYSSGIIGLRLFRNPSFDESKAARDHWNGEEFFSNINYYNDPELVRPYRVGMACSFCHVAFNPLSPPVRPSDPEWSNLASNVGSQYFKFGPVFGVTLESKNLLWQLINSPKPGSLDTSLLATDGNNNPNTMNAVYNVPARLEVAEKVASETIGSDALNMPVLEGLGLPQGAERKVPHILADGADSIGTRGALSRVWVNIGEFHEEWIQDVNIMVGVTKQRPFSIEKAKSNSVYWQVSERRAQNLALFFLKATAPMYLKDAPGGEQPKDDDMLERGKIVFAEQCFVCHSSKQPEELGFWNDPTDWRRWNQDEQYLQRAREFVLGRDFLEDNYLSTDQRYKVTDIGVNIARSLADNGKEGRVWERFTSEDYKNQPVINEVLDLQHPYDRDKTFTWTFTSDVGPGRIRPLTLSSIWSTAPFLHNNSVGDYPAGNDPANLSDPQEPDVSVDGRMKVFQDSIEKLLGLKPRRGFDSIIRTTVNTEVQLPAAVAPDLIRMQLGIPSTVLKGGLVLIFLIGLLLLVKGVIRIRAGSGIAVLNVAILLIGAILVVFVIVIRTKDVYTIGHIPAGTPTSLILNINSPGWLDDPERKGLLRRVVKDMVKVSKRKLDSLDHKDVPDLVDNLIKLNKCPDFVTDRGHTFGEDLPEADKRALIEFLKTM